MSVWQVIGLGWVGWYLTGRMPVLHPLERTGPRETWSSGIGVW
ncbi:MAG: hypothetical protein ACPLRM_09235 [Anaerolineae bacterium]